MLVIAETNHMQNW